MSGNSEGQIVEAIMSWIVKTPAALATIAFSYFSGHMWGYLIFTYKRNKKHAKGFFDNKTGKVSLGLAWHAVVAAPLYYFQYSTLKINYTNYSEIAYSVILAAIALQAIIFAFVTIFTKGD